MKLTNAPHVYVVVRRPHTAAGTLSLAKAILGAVTNAKTTFPTPNPPLTQLTTDINALDAAETAALARTKGAVQDRNAKLKVVITDLNVLRAYVQQIADGDPANALTIAHAAGMDLRKVPASSKNALNLKAGKVSGTITVSAKVAGVRQSHEWQYSADGGKTWVDLPPTLQAKTTIMGLTPGSTVEVRHRGVTKTGRQDWGQAISTMVV